MIWGGAGCQACDQHLVILLQMCSCATLGANLQRKSRYKLHETKQIKIMVWMRADKLETRCKQGSCAPGQEKFKFFLVGLYFPGQIRLLVSCILGSSSRNSDTTTIKLYLGLPLKSHWKLWLVKNGVARMACHVTLISNICGHYLRALNVLVSNSLQFTSCCTILQTTRSKA